MDHAIEHLLSLLSDENLIVNGGPARVKRLHLEELKSGVPEI